jgi:hypothetical protein
MGAKKQTPEDRAAASAKYDRIMGQANEFERLLGLPEETVMADPRYGVSLTPDQADAVLATLRLVLDGTGA